MFVCQDTALPYESGKECVAYDAANMVFEARDCSDQLDLLCFIRQRLGQQRAIIPHI